MLGLAEGLLQHSGLLNADCDGQCPWMMDRLGEQWPGEVPGQHEVDTEAHTKQSRTQGPGNSEVPQTLASGVLHKGAKVSTSQQVDGEVVGGRNRIRSKALQNLGEGVQDCRVPPLAEDGRDARRNGTQEVAREVIDSTSTKQNQGCHL